MLALPELADGFRRLVQSVTIRQQRDDFHGTEKLHGFGFGRPSARSLPEVTRMATFWFSRLF